ncbi:HlyD family secretion protein [Bartonella vinsonii]|uniref:Multidrug resistance protein vceA n=1 Tax=Bartonella vinsonii subsp. berkhoffii str. Tweed TaxID=1094502 RepID=N6UQ75_BARVB|nr:HlyD family secretion protein [Bartonella vinsonii]AGF76252.1 multidrug resistance protein vceA [Bartonella vinsonii subsp. berkhoffii str. Winnie]ENN94489.1 multidrug resistance protein vceA [Bartonella vinsonii subsp. berkhoffii str. Tweed]
MSTSETTVLTKHFKKIKQKKIIHALLVVLALFILWFSYKWITQWRYMVATEDAYVQGDIAAIAPKLNGYIEKIVIKANQIVKKDDILFHLDNGDYKIALKQTEAHLNTQQKTLLRIDAQITAAHSALDDAQAQKAAASAIATNAQLTLKRTTELKASRYAPQSVVDDAKSAYEQAIAHVHRANAQIAAARANIQVLEAQRSETESQTKSLELTREKAQRDLDSTIIRAPFDGIIANLTAKTGDFVVNGQRLAALVPLHALYIEANYKETQLQNIHAGQTAYIAVDAFKKDAFTGTVLSISPATGAVFSLLPPQNATGNFTKIVQRIPVRISIPEEILKTGRIRAGMSVSVEIDTRTKPQEKNLL